MAALKADKNNDALIDRICNPRMAFLKRLGTFATFGRGWTARIAEVRSIGQAWATEQVPQSAASMTAAKRRLSSKTLRLRPQPRRPMRRSAPALAKVVSLARCRIFRINSRRCSTAASSS
ncbi:hypothetical protein [Mesorhizobium sp. M8A.F.Ca.ET.021.01.1.1]|uniref:hypothetical protein n=1 Tax=Mesorhizobium sp. M8A.F.Ca.ET.021.01.1.1 TaxID=2496757 RepID=UPI001FE01B93|nr:hypothetical protein [Mesorhizobium sp. M8A.F.Ca.ET.021.01.1.1]